MDRRIIYRACIALEAIVLVGVVTLAYMDYSSGNTVISQSTGSSQPGVTTTTSFTGGGTIPSGTDLNFGGPTGVHLQGTQGFWAGSQTLAEAPTSIDLQGNLVATSATISGDITSGSSVHAHIVLDSATGTIKIYDSSGTLAGTIGALKIGGTDIAYLQGAQSANSQVDVTWFDGVNTSQIQMNKGTGAGEITISSADASSHTASTILTPTSIALETNDGTNSPQLLLSATGIQLGGSGTGNQAGFFGVTPIAKPTVTGSKSSGAALTSLLSALSSLGLITDSTTP